MPRAKRELKPKSPEEITLDYNIPNPTKRQRSAITDEMIAQALIANKGLQSYAAESLKIDPGHLSHRISESEYLQTVKKQCVERRLDVAEKSLSELNERKDLGSVCFILKTLGKHRGYTESTSVSVDESTMKDFKAVLGQLEEARKSKQG